MSIEDTLPEDIWLIDACDEIVWSSHLDCLDDDEPEEFVHYVKHSADKLFIKTDAIAWLCDNHPEIYEEFYERV